MRKVRCHTPRCTNTFATKDGRRRFCDACRLAKKPHPNPRPWHRRPAGMDWKTYKRLWMKAYRAGKKFHSGGLAATSKEHHFKRCFKCAYWVDEKLEEGNRRCPRCVWKN